MGLGDYEDDYGDDYDSDYLMHLILDNEKK